MRRFSPQSNSGWRRRPAGVIGLLLAAALVEAGSLFFPNSSLGSPWVRLTCLSAIVVLAAVLVDTDRRRALGRLRLAAELSRAARQPEDLAAGLAGTASRAALLFDGAAALVLVPDEEGGWSVGGSKGLCESWLGAHSNQVISRQLESALRRSSRPIQARVLPGDVFHGCTPVRHPWMLLLPIRDGEALCAILVLVTRGRPRLTGEDFETLFLIASHIQTSVANARAFEVLRREAQTDPLTGLASRRLFHDHYLRALARRQRGEPPFALVMLDVDGLKQINDRFGHPAGDEVLRAVGRILGTVRAGDLAARLGGDEFIILMPNSNRADAEHLLKRIGGQLQRLNDAQVFPFAVRLSIGVREVVDGDGDVLAEVDAAMYADKRARRSSEPARKQPRRRAG